MLRFAMTCVVVSVLSVLDGDTIKVEAHPWPNTTITTSIRISGIDTPEKGWRAKCDKERQRGARATKFATDAFVQGATVLACNVRNGKYAGRVLADVYIDGVNYADAILDANLATTYDGGTKPNWCKGKR